VSAGFSDPRWTHLGVFITLFLLVTVVVNGQIHRQYQNDWPYLEVDFAENSKLKSLERVQAFGAFGEHWPLTTERARGGAVGLMVLLVTLCAGAEIRLKRRVEPPREVRSEPRLDRLVTAPPPALTPLNSPVLPVPGSRVATRPTGTALTPAPVTSGATKRPTAPKQAPLVTLSHAVPAPVAPPDDKARRIAAIAHFEAGRYPAAVSAFQELLRQDAPDRTTIEAYLAASFLEMGQADMAAAALDDLQNRPVPDEPLYLVAYICSQRGLRREARDLFRKLHAQSPKFRDVAERIESLSEVQEAPLELQMASFLPQRYQEPVLVGQGGIGMVFRAKDTQLDKIVAVKMMLPIHKGNADLEQRFLREAQSL
jgi:tetratricopeptide (TPR) repeat protein